MKLAKGRFEAELNEIEKLLQKIDFFEERNHFPNHKFDPTLYRNKNYIENWESHISENIYNFILKDNSILYFKFTARGESESKLNFKFYECPFHCLTYDEYLQENNLMEDIDEKSLYVYYEMYLQQCNPKENPLMIRYDLDIDSYFEGLHPISHIHIGNRNNVRIGMQKILTPKSFVSFIFRQHYPSIWKKLIAESLFLQTSYLKEKSNLSEINSKFWNILDLAEFYLT